MRRVFLFMTIVISSCGIWWPPRNLTDDAFYNIEDISIRLIIKYDKDSLYKTTYEQRYNLPGKYYKLLSTSDKIDTTYLLGVQLKLWTEIIEQNGTAYYGAYPRNGLLQKIDKIKIQFSDEKHIYDITPFLRGDSSIYDIKWTKLNIKKTPYTYGQSPYFKDISSWRDRLNNNASTLERIQSHDYIFWLERQAIKSLWFKPTMLKCEMIFVDTTGTKHRLLVDSVIIN